MTFKVVYEEVFDRRGWEKGEGEGGGEEGEGKLRSTFENIHISSSALTHPHVVSSLIINLFINVYYQPISQACWTMKERAARAAGGSS